MQLRQVTDISRAPVSGASVHYLPGRRFEYVASAPGWRVIGLASAALAAISVGALLAFLLLRPGVPLRVEADATTDGMVVRYILSGVKLTDAQFVTQTATWLFSDGTILPAAIYRADGLVLNSPEAPPVEPRLQGETFVSQTFRVEVPAAAFSDVGATLRVCFIYEGTPAYCPVNLRFADVPRVVPEQGDDPLAPARSAHVPSLGPL